MSAVMSGWKYGGKQHIYTVSMYSYKWLINNKRKTVTLEWRSMYQSELSPVIGKNQHHMTPHMPWEEYSIASVEFQQQTLNQGWFYKFLSYILLKKCQYQGYIGKSL